MLFMFVVVDLYIAFIKLLYNGIEEETILRLSASEEREEILRDCA